MVRLFIHNVKIIWTLEGYINIFESAWDRTKQHHYVLYIIIRYYMMWEKHHVFQRIEMKQKDPNVFRIEFRISIIICFSTPYVVITYPNYHYHYTPTALVFTIKQAYVIGSSLFKLNKKCQLVNIIELLFPWKLFGFVVPE